MFSFNVYFLKECQAHIPSVQCLLIVPDVLS